ncbi:MAG: zf-HC2 domain-containing protein [Streptosporangiaceae bacterium]|nr:zf-HC2 domain-containing protein [Streptosporangiaceae bacterium]MBV9853627.1 zf-HC2 domain-containing protein [Streptosporangiaceae bacterium]
MSHLGEYLSALIDGELTGAELDRASAHLAGCAECRAEAAGLRELKRELRGLAATPADAELTRRLLSMAGPGGPVPSRQRLIRGMARPRAMFRAYPDRSFHDHARSRSGRPGRLGAERPGSARPAAYPGPARRRGRYVVWGAVSLVVVGIGAAAFSVGGSAGVPGPRITPPVEMYSVEHAIETGQVPYPAPSATDELSSP